MFQRYVSSVFSDACCNYVYLDVVYVSHICCMCFIWMLCMGCNGFQVCFRCFFQVFQKHVSTAFRRMLQPMYLDVSKVDQVFHLSSSLLLLHRLSRSQQGIHMTPQSGPSESEAPHTLLLLSLGAARAPRAAQNGHNAERRGRGLRKGA